MEIQGYYVFISRNFMPLQTEFVASSEKENCETENGLRNLRCRRNILYGFSKCKKISQFSVSQNGRKVVEKRIDGDEAKSVVEFFARDLDAFCMYIGKSL